MWSSRGRNGTDVHERDRLGAAIPLEPLALGEGHRAGAAEQAPAPSRHKAEALAAMAEIYEERGEAEMALELLKRALAARSVSSAA